MKPLLVANVKVILGTKAFNSTYGMFVNNLHPLEMLDDSKIVMIFTHSFLISAYVWPK